jgi:hypothetical protein
MLMKTRGMFISTVLMNMRGVFISRVLMNMRGVFISTREGAARQT